MTGFSPGDVEIGEAMLTGPLGTVDIRRRLQDVSIFQSIQKSYTSVELTFVDNSNLINLNGGLDGDNLFTFSAGQTGQDPYEDTWTLTSIEKSVRLSNQRTQVYRATGYSPHMTKFPKVQKSYKDVPLTDVVKDLVTNFLGPLKPLLIGAPSRGVAGTTRMPYNVNGIGIHKAIRAAMLRAASTVDQSSAYVFFENHKHMVLDTLENLQSQALGSPVATFIQKPMGANFFADVAVQPFVIMDMIEESRIDSTTTAQSQKQAVQTFDLFGQAFKAVAGEVQQAFSYLNIPYNSMRPPTFAQQFMPKRQQVAAAFDTQSVTIHVSLHPEVEVGKGFSVSTLGPAGDTDEATPDAISGPLLCTECRHTIKLGQGRPQGTTTAKGVKGTQG